MVDGKIEEKIKKLLDAFRPSQLDEQLLTVCPFYKPENKELSSAYRLVHDIAKSRLLARLQLKLNKSDVANEVSLKLGYVNGAISRVYITGGNGCSALIEVKTGSVKLVQPAIYTLLSRTKTILVDLRSGGILVIDVQTAEKILQELIEHLKDKEELKKLGKRVPGPECWRCGQTANNRKRD